MRALLLVLALLSAPAWAVEDDKKLHFAASFVFGFAAGAQWPDNKPLAFGVAMIPGVAKEMIDAQSGGTGFSGKDLVADAIGAALGVYAGGWMVRRSGGTTTIAYATTFR